MGARSVGSYLVGVACVFVAAGILLFTTAGNIYAQTLPSQQVDTVTGGPLKLAQTFYFPNYPYPQVRTKKRRYRPRVTRRCAFPWTYSRGLRKCICVQEGYGLSGGDCVKTAEVCPGNAQWSEQEKKCLCQEGFVENGSQCVDPNAGVTAYGPSDGSQCLWPRVKAESGNGCECVPGYHEDSGQCLRDEPAVAGQRPHARPDELLTSEIELIQKCLKEAGYLRDEVQGTMGRKAWTAFWFFKQDYSVGRTPKGVHDAKAQHKLFTLCPGASTRLAVTPPAAGRPQQGPAPVAASATGLAPVDTLSGAPAQAEKKQARLSPPAVPGTPPAPAMKMPVNRIYARPEAGCLPPDLHKLIVGTYGARDGLKKCSKTCIAIPANLSKREIAEYENRRGIRWCRSCIEIGSQLPLDDILKLERGADVQVCPRPPSRLPKWSPASDSKRPVFTRVRELYTPFPRGAAHENRIAVIIGNASYAKGIPRNASAHANAGAFHALLSEHLGFAQENIIDLRDARAEDLTRVFGTVEEHRGELWRKMQEHPKASLVIYYAGHAGTRADHGDSYLLPVDAVKYREERAGYAMSTLYANLDKLGAQSVLMLLEAGFGRDLSDYVFPPNLPETQAYALPRKAMRSITVLTAADGDQKTLDDPRFGTGLFTRYLIEGLAGRADLRPIGNGDGKIDAVELHAYTSHMVRLAARKSFGLLQRPMLSHTGNVRVSVVQAALR